MTLSEVGKVKALGMDDLAFKKGNTYGTSLAELKRHSMADRPEFHLKADQDARRLLEADLESCPAETRSERHEVLERVLRWLG